MKIRLLATLFATTLLGGCATYDYTSGNAPGGYYHGRPSVEYYGPYGGGYGYGPGYGYGYGPALGGYGSYGYGRGARHYGGSYFGSYRGFYRHPYRHPYRPYPPSGYPRPPRPDHDGRPARGDRPPPWRAPDGRYLETGEVMIPPNAGGTPQASGQPAWRNPGGQQAGAPRQLATPAPARAEQVRPSAPRQMERAPQPRSSHMENGERISEP